MAATGGNNLAMRDQTVRETLTAIASGRIDETHDVKKAIELGYAKKDESVFRPGFRLSLTQKGIAELGVL